MAVTVGDFLLQRLSDWGVRRVYGYPGDAINGVTGAFGRIGSQMRFVHARHTSLSAFIVWAHAKSTDNIGMCVETSGSGAFHFLPGFCDAKLDHPSVLASMGQQQRALTSRVPTVLEMGINPEAPPVPPQASGKQATAHVSALRHRDPEATRMVIASCKEWEDAQLRSGKK